MTIKKNSSKKYPDWLVHDYQLRLDWYGLGLAFIFVLLPNVLFLLGAYLTGIARPLINVDYLPVCVLWALPYRVAKWLGVFAFIIVALIDAMMMAMQLFPFLDVAAAISLAPFLVNAPARYMLLAGLVVVCMVIIPVAMIYLSKKWFVKKSSFVLVLFWAVIGGLAYHKFNEYRYATHAQAERFAQSDFFYIHSQYKRYQWMVGSEFAEHFGKIPEMMPTDIAYISHHLGVDKQGVTIPISRPIVTAENSDKVTGDKVTGDKGVDIGDVPRNLPNKMLFVVAESWGVARDSEAQKDILAGLYDRSEHFEFVDTGYFGFSGATVEGELRELCQLDVEGGYGFRKLDDTPFEGCLPQRLSAQGYQTVGMHAGFSGIYERDILYRHMGFKKLVFAEQYNDRKHCSPFNGICDSELFDVVEQEFATNDKLFYYWLTLTSHSPFAEKDMVNPRFDCDKYGIPKGDICNNFRLNAQYFDGLGELLAKPSMKGVEVIVVGDHMPPIISRQPIHPYIQWQDVSWVHLKVKE
ncbi:sulfatase-like hydrolase/transferase [Moraxella lacunata]|uniref:Sulfatase N-terminal domain-containing protein n=1 Tax=Moraxella lacunata TaxID=477 RepID=A0A1B8PVU0_MORLA|nr:sulfatase-like hydrolase/transferase [Moraxella lacunata]OBX59609.1 hypothetical protein A9309_11140 [Moraxella lacunata]